MFNSDFFGIIVILVIALIIIHFVRKHFKSLTIPNVYLITGAVKSGKSLLAVHIARKEYRKEVRHWYIRKFFQQLLHRETDMKPMLYSNIPLAKTKFNLLTKDIIMQKVRIPNKSVVLIDEASLLADSMLFKNNDVNNALMRFVKLFGHYSHGGKLIIDTQAICDLHFSFKRCMSNYLYIYSRSKLPFFTIMKVREMMYSEDNSVVNNVNEDIELSLRKIFIWNWSYKLYDCYCYSSFTDHLAYQVNYEVDKKSVKDDLKVYEVVSFHDFAKVMNESIKEKSNNA